MGGLIVGCHVEGCSKPATEGLGGAELCDMHARRKRRGMPMVTPEVLSPEEALYRAGLDYAEAESDHDYALARRAIRAAAHHYVATSRGAAGTLSGLLRRLEARLGARLEPSSEATGSLEGLLKRLTSRLGPLSGEAAAHDRPN